MICFKYFMKHFVIRNYKNTPNIVFLFFSSSNLINITELPLEYNSTINRPYLLFNLHVNY
jgi:hypothetical protein